MSAFSLSLVSVENGRELLLGGPSEYMIGRGPLVKITDKRVSRNHAVLCLEEDGNVKICPKHNNPFFQKSSGADKFLVLAKNEWHVLKDTDQIAFLPNELVFSIKVIKSSNEENTSDTSPVIESQPMNELAMDITTTTTTNVPSSQDHTPSQSSVAPMDHTPSQSLSVGGSGRKRNLPSWMRELSSTSVSENNKKVTKTVKKEKQSTVVVKAKPKVEKKKSSDAMKDAPTIINDPTSPTLLDSMGSPTSSTNDNEPLPKKPLPRCPYGQSCYRKNPAHFKEFSHKDESEGEEEEEEEDRPECPFGTSCYRKNPAHTRQFKHTGPPAPAGSKRVRTSTRTRKKPKQSILSGDSDDEGEPNTYDYNDSFIDDNGGGDSSSSTSFKGSSEDDDWCPAPKDEEDLGELVSEANDFLSNKKMH